MGKNLKLETRWQPAGDVKLAFCVNPSLLRTIGTASGEVTIFRPSVMYHSHGTYQERKRVLKPKAKAKLVIAGPISSQAFRSVSVRTIRELFVFFWFALYGRTSGF